MRVLVVGYGSIGKRHIVNLLERDDIEHIFVLTSVDPILSNHGGHKKVTFIKPTVSDTPDLACLLPVKLTKPDFAIIANETVKHIDWAISLGKMGINLFVEKPLSHTLDRVRELQDVADEKKIKIMVGYNLRFLGVMTIMKEYLSRGGLGDVYFAKIEVGQYLPSWRNGVDYKTTYSANKSMGGGVALDLSHEIDYMKYLLGFPLSWKIVKDKVSELVITSEDIFEGVYQYKNYLCNVHMDYLQRHKKRDCRIVGSKGSLVCDFVKNYLELQGSIAGDIRIDNPAAFDVDETYKTELEKFIRAIQSDEVPAPTIDDGIDALKLIEEEYVQA